MTLIRSAGGLKSVHLFYKVDYMVYCEGGTQINADDIETGGGDSNTLDALFWTHVLRANGFRSVHVKSVGAKAVILRLRERLNTVGECSVLLCADRDYDDEFAQTEDGIIYTYGYSWENDVVNLGCVYQLAERLFGAGEIADQIASEVRNDLETLLISMRRLIESDMTLVCKGRVGIFDRSSPLSVVNITTTPPQLDLARVNAILRARGYRRGPRRLRPIADEETRHKLVGKVLSCLVHRVFSSSARLRERRFNTNYQTFMRFLIGELQTAFAGAGSEPIRGYYERQLTEFTN